MSASSTTSDWSGTVVVAASVELVSGGNDVVVVAESGSGTPVVVAFLDVGSVDTSVVDATASVVVAMLSVCATGTAVDSSPHDDSTNASATENGATRRTSFTRSVLLR